MHTRQKGSTILYTILVGVLILGAFIAGYGMRFAQDIFGLSGKTALNNSAQAVQVQKNNPNIDFDLFWKIWDLVKNDHINGSIEDQKIFYGALAGVAQSADDPYTVFMDPELTKIFSSDLSGEFEGIGAEIGMNKDKQLVVVAPLPGSPAEKAGLVANDAILKIDDKDTAGLSVDEAVVLIRGPKGSSVKLTVYHEGALDTQEVSIVRDVIHIENIKYKLIEHNGKRISYISIAQFDENSSKDFAAQANKVLLDSPDSLIIDLRNNPGGLLTSSVDIASQFILEGTIVSEKNNKGESHTYRSTGSGILAGMPKVVVLINEGSASASEILAGALQDTNKAILIGEQSFGKGSVQDYRQFPDGSSLKITVAKWFTPHDNSIDKEGITPNILVPMNYEDYQAKRDPQLDKALEELTK